MDALIQEIENIDINVNTICMYRCMHMYVGRQYQKKEHNQRIVD